MSKKTQTEKLISSLEFFNVDRLVIDKVVEIVEERLKMAYQEGYGKGIFDTESKIHQVKKRAGQNQPKKQPKYLRQEVNKLGYKSVSVKQMLRDE